MFSFLQQPGDDGVGVAFTDRDGGVSAPDLGPLNLGRTDADDVHAVARNGELVLAATGARVLVATNQVHGRGVLRVDEAMLAGWGPRSWLGADGGAAPLPRADAAVTALPGVALLVRVADCVPVVLADRGRGVLGVAHAGRAGFDLGVVGATVEAMSALGATRLEAWVGPHVCGECYEVPQQMADELEARHPGVASRTSWGTPALDLGAGVEQQLQALDVAVARVDPCTRTSPELHSHRRDGVRAGRLAGMVWRVSRPMPEAKAASVR